MSQTLPSVTIVIPTHNRESSLKRLLDKLCEQTYPLHLIQVIVVADGCIDGTVGLLKQYKAGYKFSFIQLPGSGPAIARNRGVALATGKILLFLDDDIDPSAGLVAAHVKEHIHDKTVVIGYLPFPIQGKPDYFKQNLRIWWEDKFYSMLNPAYQFSYEDLLTGNVSLSLDLFRKVNGFDETLRCREDYELGARLIKEGATFVFSKEAWGYHRDEVTNLSRSLKRKRAEGKADVQCRHLHPDIAASLRDAYSSLAHVIKRRKLVSVMTKWPRFTDSVARLGERLAKTAEWLQFRSTWSQLNLKLHNYWYLRGALEVLDSRTALENYIQQFSNQDLPQEEMVIDLKQGIDAAAQLIDCARPGGLIISYEGEYLGYVPYKPGSERLKGKHLKPLVAIHCAYPLLKVLAFQELSNSSVNTNETPKQTLLSQTISS